MSNDLRTYVKLMLERIRSTSSNKFNLNQFKSLNDPGEIFQYANERLQELGTGSSRAVFALTPTKVLKIAKDKVVKKGTSGVVKGRAQNEAEVDIATQPGLMPIMTKIHDAHPEYNWIIADAVREMRGDVDILDILQVDADGEYEDEIFSEILQYAWENGSEYFDEEFEYETMDGGLALNTFMDAVHHIRTETNLSPGDVGHAEHWGLTPDGRLVILDYGLTYDVAKHYE